MHKIISPRTSRSVCNSPPNSDGWSECATSELLRPLTLFASPSLIAPPTHTALPVPVRCYAPKSGGLSVLALAPVTFDKPVAAAPSGLRRMLSTPEPTPVSSCLAGFDGLGGVRSCHPTTMFRRDICPPPALPRDGVFGVLRNPETEECGEDAGKVESPLGVASDPDFVDDDFGDLGDLGGGGMGERAGRKTRRAVGFTW